MTDRDWKKELETVGAAIGKAYKIRDGKRVACIGDKRLYDPTSTHPIIVVNENQIIWQYYLDGTTSRLVGEMPNDIVGHWEELKIDTSRIKVRKLKEAGYEQALFGISLNKEQPIENMPTVAEKLAKSAYGSHRKYLRQICLWWELRLPRKLWAEFDTYKIGVVRNSGSTVFNIHKAPFKQEDFDFDLKEPFLNLLNEYWSDFINGKMSLDEFKSYLPEGYLQTSVVTMNYEVLRSIYNDRKYHKLPGWQRILTLMMDQIDHPELIC